MINQSKYIIICIPAPLDENNYPDLTILKNVCQKISKYLKKEQVIILESTVNPEVCEETVKPILEESGFFRRSRFSSCSLPRYKKFRNIVSMSYGEVPILCQGCRAYNTEEREKNGEFQNGYNLKKCEY